MDDLGLCYRLGRGTPRNDVLAFHWIEVVANHGRVRATTGVAELYLNGEGVARDDRKAAEWLTKAAKLGEVKAQLALASRWPLSIISAAA